MTTSYAMTLKHTGSADNFIKTDIALPLPDKNEVTVKHTAIGLNYIDVYHRTGLYPVPEFPVTLGLEAAGVIEACGDNVKDLKPGDRIAYGTGPFGAYASHRTIEAAKVIKLPNVISDDIAAAIMLKGMTAEYLIHRAYPVKKGDVVLFHAISGGVGTLACQWLKHLGATVIGTAGSADKADKAKAYGCDHVIRYDTDDTVKAVMDITDGQGVPVVYDSVGQSTFEASLNCLAPRGTMVSFGQSSGAIQSFDPAVLAQKGSLYYTRPSLMDYTKTREDLETSAGKVFSAIEHGAIDVHIGQHFDLADVGKAHKALENRKTTGATILRP